MLRLLAPCRRLLIPPSTSYATAATTASAPPPQPPSSSSGGGTKRTINDDAIKVTERCIKRLKEITEDGEALRVEVDGGGCSGFEYKMRLDRNVADDDLILDRDGVRIIVDEMSLGYMRGATVDYVEDLMKSAFRVVSNPVAEKGCSCGSSFALKMD